MKQVSKRVNTALKTAFITALVIAVVKESFTEASNTEVVLYLAGMSLTIIAFKYVWSD